MIHICPLDWELKFAFSSDLSEAESLLLFLRMYPIRRPLAIYRSNSEPSPGRWMFSKLLSVKQLEKFVRSLQNRLSPSEVSQK